MYHLWKTGRFDMIRQVNKKELNETVLLSTAYDVVSSVYKIDLSRTAAAIFHIKQNAARWENDIDSPKDYDAFQKNFSQAATRS
jgi:hypothetical protein